MTVEIVLKSFDITVGDRLGEYVQDKAEKVDRYINDVQSVVVELRHFETAREVTDRYRAQITLFGKGFTLRAEESAEDITIAFDEAFIHLKRRIERYKGKRNRGRGDGKTLAEDALEQLETAIEMEEEQYEPEIIRRKHLMLIPMDEYEAIEQSRLLGHENFFIFYNMTTDSVNVLYRRKDGAYGLIETEVG